MTKGEARKLYLGYLGEATVNGSEKNDPDLKAAFDTLLPGAVLYVGLAYPKKEVTEVPAVWEAPENLIEVTKAVDEAGNPVPFDTMGNTYRFDRACTVEYTRLPQEVASTAPEETVLDLEKTVCMLVPIKAGIDAALSIDAIAYKGTYLVNTYNSLAASIGKEDAAAFRRVYAV